MSCEITRDNYTLRVSVTSGCNLNCVYCNPTKSPYEMSDDVLMRIIKAASFAGIQKISWTGGEPTTRANFVDFVRTAREIGIKKQGMTTNGILFHTMGEDLKNAGLSRVNISLDTLDSAEFKRITKRDGLSNVLQSIKKATELFDRVKINCVVTKSNTHMINRFIDFAQQYDDKLTVRFLEIVPCNNPSEKDLAAFHNEFVPVTEIQKTFESIGTLEPYENTGDVPKSKYFKISGKKGVFGLNPNYSVGYHCDEERCPKIRVSPTGYVSNCTIDLSFCRNFNGLNQNESNKLMQQIVIEKENRNYNGFRHEQKYYDFWRFGIKPNILTL